MPSVAWIHSQFLHFSSRGTQRTHKSDCLCLHASEKFIKNLHVFFFYIWEFSPVFFFFFTSIHKHYHWRVDDDGTILSQGQSDERWKIFLQRDGASARRPDDIICLCGVLWNDTAQFSGLRNLRQTRSVSMNTICVCSGFWECCCITGAVNLREGIRDLMCIDY